MQSIAQFGAAGSAPPLLADAMRRTAGAADTLDVRVLLAHAIDDGVRAFYQRFGFEESPTDPVNLQLPIKDLRASLGQP